MPDTDFICYGGCFEIAKVTKKLEFRDLELESGWFYISNVLRAENDVVDKETVAEAETFAREVASIQNTGDTYKKTLLTMDLMEANDAGIARKNVINWLAEQ